MTPSFSGRHMAAILFAFFGVVIVVNLGMAWLAQTTFGGLVVDNGYVASQQFNHWLEEGRADRALGWNAKLRWLPGGRLEIDLVDVPRPASISGLARHRLGRLPDRTLNFIALGPSRFLSTMSLPPDRWQLRLDVTASGRNWRTERALP